MHTREQPVPVPPTPGRPSGRRVHLDVIKVAVIAGVIFGHAWAGYDALGGWAYTNAREVDMAPLTRTLLEAVLGPFALFSMGLMFLIAGLLTPGSVDRKGPGRAARHRLVRLGVPWLVFALLLWPPLHWYLAGISGRQPGPLWTYWLRALRDPDPEQVWFLLVLLIFSLGYAAWRAATSAPPAPRSQLTVRQLLALAAAIAVGSFLVRTEYQLGTSRDIQFHLEQWPQFVGLYLLGLLAAPRGWLDPVPDRLRRDCGIAAVVAVLAIGAFAVVVAVAGVPASAFLGGWHWASAVTAVVEGVLATTLSVWVLGQAQRHPPRRDPARLARAAFPAYLVQGHVLVGLALLMRPAAVPAEVKAAVVSVCGVVLSFGLGWLLATTTRRRRGAGAPSTAVPVVR